MSALDKALLAAHAADDHGALIGLYTQAADQVGDEDAACFYLTHAYIFALEQGDGRAMALHERLRCAGREE